MGKLSSMLYCQYPCPTFMSFFAFISHCFPTSIWLFKPLTTFAPHLWALFFYFLGLSCLQHLWFLTTLCTMSNLFSWISLIVSIISSTILAILISICVLPSWRQPCSLSSDFLDPGHSTFQSSAQLWKPQFLLKFLQNSFPSWLNWKWPKHPK